MEPPEAAPQPNAPRCCGSPAVSTSCPPLLTRRGTDTHRQSICSRKQYILQFVQRSELLERVDAPQEPGWSLSRWKEESLLQASLQRSLQLRAVCLPQGWFCCGEDTEEQFPTEQRLLRGQRARLWGMWQAGCRSVSFAATEIIAGVGLEIPPVRACHEDGGQVVGDSCLQGTGGKSVPNRMQHAEVFPEEVQLWHSAALRAARAAANDGL